MDKTFIDSKLAGEFLDSRGEFDRSFPSTGWEVPDSVEIDGDRILWKMKRKLEDRKRLKSPPPDLLTRFLSLDINKPVEIRDYARKFGVFSIGACGRPAYTHRHDGKPLFSVCKGTWGDHRLVISDEMIDQERNTCSPLGYELDTANEAWEGWEPIGAWRYYIRRARAILSVAANVRQNRLANYDDLVTLCDCVPASKNEVETWIDIPRVNDEHLKFFAYEGGKTVEYHRYLASNALNQWFDMASDVLDQSVEFAFFWDEQNAEFRVVGNHFGMLAFQLGLAIAGSESLAICSGCSMSYIPERRPRPNQRHYCQTCRKRMIPQRDAMRDQRARLAAKKPAQKTVVKTEGELSRKTGKSQGKSRQRHKHKNPRG